jgi:hypothetical protein
MAASLAGVIAEPAVKRQRIMQVTVSVIRAAQLDESYAQKVMRKRLRGVVVKAVGGGQR